MILNKNVCKMFKGCLSKTLMKVSSVSVILFLSIPVAFAEPIELKFGHSAGLSTLKGLSATEFAKRVNDEMGDKVHVTVFGSSQLGKDREMLGRLRLGTLNFQLPSSVMSSVADEFGVFDMPYLVEDRQQMVRARENFLPILQAAADRQGYKILAVWENGFRNITNNLKPVVSPQDLSSLKLRVPKGKWRVQMFKEYGANPTPMSLAEVFTALQTGVIDGQENPLSIIDGNKFYEVQQYLSLTRHVYTPAYLLVGKNAWNKLPQDIRENLQRIAIEMQDWVYQTGERLDKELVVKFEKGGMEINEIDRKAFIDASDVIYKRFEKEVNNGAELIKYIKDAQ